jgi:hypothetical protein
LIPAQYRQRRPERQSDLPQPGTSAPNAALPRQAEPPKSQFAGAMRRLQEAKRLLDEGLINEDEFQAKKRQIMESL